MEVAEILSELLKKAVADEAVKQKLIKTREDKNKVTSFCKVCTELGYPLYEMDLISAGENYYAAMRRSTNGGGENSPLLKGEDDYYEMIFAELENAVKYGK